MLVTRIDILDNMPHLKICTGYKIDGKTFNDFPASIAMLEKCEPVLEDIAGWVGPTSDIRKFKDLPPNARRYVERLEEIVGCPASLISVGKHREQTVVRKPIF
jgi:adenylosuccinate synthase